MKSPSPSAMLVRFMFFIIGIFLKTGKSREINGSFIGKLPMAPIASGSAILTGLKPKKALKKSIILSSPFSITCCASGPTCCFSRSDRIKPSMI